jgi:hypothetical protein
VTGLAQTRGLLSTALLLAFLAGVSAPVFPGGVASAGSPLRMSVAIPAHAGDADVVMLEVSLTAAARPKTGHLGALVRLRRPDGRAVELGRVSIAPSRAGEAQHYQFNVAGALRGLPAQGGSAVVEVEAIDRGGGSAAGARLAIQSARIVTR